MLIKYDNEQTDEWMIELIDNLIHKHDKCTNKWLNEWTQAE